MPMMEKVKWAYYPPSVVVGDRIFPISHDYPTGGNMQITVFDLERVIQISPALVQDVPSCVRIVLEKWISQYKTQAIGDLIEKLLIQKFFSDSHKNWHICLPSVIPSAPKYIECENMKFSCLVTRYIPGMSLATSINKLGTLEQECIYSILISFLSVLHAVPLAGGCDKSLRDYYKQRINSITESLLWLKQIGVNVDWRLLASLGNHYTRLIDVVIDQEERLTQVHGDFRLENVIINPDAGTLSVIDFEQGIYGGDWLCDLWKLKVLFDGVNNPPNNIVAIIKQSYGGSAVKFFECLNYHNLLKKRVDLIRIDTFVSLFIFRSLMGWNFYEAITDLGQTIRGTKFINGLLKKLDERLKN